MKLNKDDIFFNYNEEFKKIMEICRPSVTEIFLYYICYPQQFFRDMNMENALKHFLKK